MIHVNAELAQVQNILNNSIKPNPDRAIKLLTPFLKRDQKNWMVYHFLGVAHLQKKKYQKAINYLNRAIDVGGKEPETFHLISLGFKELGDFDESISFASKALERNDKFVQAWMNLGAVYKAKAELDNALKAYKRANQLDPKNAGIAYRLASIYTDQGDHVQGKKLYEITIQMDENYVEAYLGLAQIHQKFYRFEEALETIKKALEKDPKSLLARVELATAYKTVGDYDEAIRINEQLIKEYPKLGLLRVNYALCFQEIARFNEAEKHYKKAFEVDPSISESISNYLMTIHYNPERTKEEIFDAHLLWDKYFAPKQRPARPVPSNLDPNKKLRIGILSGGFRKHPVGWMIVKAIEHLPDDQIEVYGYTSHSMYDELTSRLHAKAKKWTSVIGYNDAVVADLIKDDKVDILVELSGHASLNRLKTVALEPAPISVKWVGGLFNTTGLESMDFLLTDWYETPDGEEEFYTEKLVRLPDDYIVYQVPTYEGIEVNDLPALKNGFITFGCFNNPTKINPVLLEKWAQIMKSTPKSKLFLKSKQYDTTTFVDRIVELMDGFGIEKDRLIFEGQSLHDELLNCYNRIDIALDPWPYSGGLTTCEALWMGVPVVTNSGPTFAGRHSATHLINAGFSEWVTNNWEDYHNAVVALTQNLDKLSELRATLRNTVLDSPLCDGKRFAAHLAMAFRKMWHQRVNGYKLDLEEGEWQDHINVEELSDSEIEQLSSGCIHKVGERRVFESHVIENKMVRTQQGLQVSVPDSLQELTSYSYAEKNTWLDKEIDFVNGFLQKGMTVIDVGASYGAYTIPMANKVGHKGKVVAFEPIIEMSQHLKEGASVNNFPQIEVHAKAVSLAKGEVSYIYDTQLEFSGLDEEGNSQVSSIALDEYWLNNNQFNVDLLKIDVNGSELEVLESATAMLTELTPTLVIATSSDIRIQNEIIEYVRSHDYHLFEYISELEILAPFEGELTSSFVANLVAIHSSKLNEESIKNWIYNEQQLGGKVEEKSWKEFVSTFNWVEGLPVDWQKESELTLEEEYLSALDLIASAEELLRNPFSEYRKSNIQATEWMLAAAGKLIDIYHSSNQSIPIELTLSRVLLTLGKRENSVSILKNAVEKLMSGIELVDFKTPFLLPIKDQDYTRISHDPTSWLKVKALEAWLLLKEKSSYFSNQKDIQYLSGLGGNPDSLPLINKIVDDLLPVKMKKSKAGGTFIHIAFNHVYTKSLVDLLEYTNANSDQKHQLYVEHHPSIEGYSVDISKNTNAVFFDSLRHMSIIEQKCLAEQVDGIIFHGIFFDYQKDLIQKIGDKKHIGWVLWGGDLYTPIKNEEPLYEVVNHINSIYSIVDGDINMFKDAYGERASFTFSYPYPGLYEKSDHVQHLKKKNRIIVGNSGDPSNNHIEIIRNLAAKKDIQEYMILLPVAYNLHEDYEAILLKEAKRLGIENNVQLHKDFINPEDYYELIASSSLVLTAHNRQQAVGNMLMAMHSGVDLFLKQNINIGDEIQENPTWNFMRSNGLTPNDIESFYRGESIQEFVGIQADLVKEHRSIINTEFGLKQRFNELTSNARNIKSPVNNYV